MIRLIGLVMRTATFLWREDIFAEEPLEEDRAALRRDIDSRCAVQAERKELMHQIPAITPIPAIIPTRMDAKGLQYLHVAGFRAF